MKKRSFTEYTEKQLNMFTGWYDIIIEYFDKIEKYILDNDYKNKNWYDFKIEYIKEKYWRFDMTLSWFDDYLFDLCNELEKKSEETCIVCWKPWEVRYDLGWYLSLCDEHYKEKKDKMHVFYVNKE